MWDVRELTLDIEQRHLVCWWNSTALAQPMFQGMAADTAVVWVLTLHCRTQGCETMPNLGFQEIGKPQKNGEDLGGFQLRKFVLGLKGPVHSGSGR